MFLVSGVCCLNWGVDGLLCLLLVCGFNCLVFGFVCCLCMISVVLWWSLWFMGSELNLFWIWWLCLVC